jgi:hypothetical protein
MKTRNTVTTHQPGAKRIGSRQQATPSHHHGNRRSQQNMNSRVRAGRTERSDEEQTTNGPPGAQAAQRPGPADRKNRTATHRPPYRRAKRALWVVSLGAEVTNGHAAAVPAQRARQASSGGIEKESERQETDRPLVTEALRKAKGRGARSRVLLLWRSLSSHKNCQAPSSRLSPARYAAPLAIRPSTSRRKRVLVR